MIFSNFKIYPRMRGWTSISQSPGSYTSWHFSARYAGGIVVHVLPPKINSTWIRVLWNSSSLGIQYDYQTQGIDINGEQSSGFPVLPTSNVEIGIRNTLTTGNIIYFVSIDYYF